MYLLQGEESFDSAHFLRGHDGKCANLHGHRWRVVYGIKANNLISEGSSREMVVDFSHIKNVAKEYFNGLDHALILEELREEQGMGTAEHNFLQACLGMGFSVIAMPCRTTAENMSKYFFEVLGEIFKERLEDWNYEMDFVTVYETPNNAATYRRA